MRRAAVAAVLGIMFVLGCLAAVGAASSGKDCGRGPGAKPGFGEPTDGHFVRCSSGTLTLTIPTVTVPTVPDVTIPEVPTETLPDVPTETLPGVSEIPGNKPETEKSSVRVRFRHSRKIREIEIVVPEHAPPAGSDVSVEPAKRSSVFHASPELVVAALIAGAGAAIGICIAGHASAAAVRPK